jgi:hypothetical protein
VTEPSHAVFLSYASQDADAAKRICDALRAAGIEVWFDLVPSYPGDFGQTGQAGPFAPRRHKAGPAAAAAACFTSASNGHGAALYQAGAYEFAGPSSGRQGAGATNRVFRLAPRRP